MPPHTSHSDALAHVARMIRGLIFSIEAGCTGPSGPALVHHSGMIVSTVLTPANSDEREAALALVLSVDGGIALGDLGYRSHLNWLVETLADEADVLLIHPAGAEDKLENDQVNPQRALIRSVRERVETSFSSL